MIAWTFDKSFATCFYESMNGIKVGNKKADVAGASYRQSDLNVVREGMPAYLMLLDGMNRAWPDNDRLLLAAAQGYASFASAFIEEHDKV